MKKLLTETILVFTICLCAALALADFGVRDQNEYRNKVKNSTVTKDKIKELPQGLVATGTILALSFESKTLKLSISDGTSLDVSISDIAVWKAGKEVSLQDLKADQNVKVTYYIYSAGNAAQFVEILPEISASS